MPRPKAVRRGGVAVSEGAAYDIKANGARVGRGSVSGDQRLAREISRALGKMPANEPTQNNCFRDSKEAWHALKTGAAKPTAGRP